MERTGLLECEGARAVASGRLIVFEGCKGISKPRRVERLAATASDLGVDGASEEALRPGMLATIQWRAASVSGSGAPGCPARAGLAASPRGDADAAAWGSDAQPTAAVDPSGVRGEQS